MVVISLNVVCVSNYNLEMRSFSGHNVVGNKHTTKYSKGFGHCLYFLLTISPNGFYKSVVIKKMGHITTYEHKMSIAEGQIP